MSVHIKEGTEANSPCPTCGKTLPDVVDEKGFVSSDVWLFFGKFYCSAKCAYDASLKCMSVQIARGLDE